MSESHEYHRGWMRTKDHFSHVTGDVKARVKRKDGSQGYSMPMFSMYDSPCDTQQYWQDPNGATHEKLFYPEWAFLKKDGGKAS